MSSIDPAGSAHALGARALLARNASGLYAATLFVSALLLFALQPMFAKMVLPLLGGAPGVWAVAMVFFQAALLLGYAYAHLLARTLPPGRAALVHLIVLAVAAFSLPVGVSNLLGEPPTERIETWLILLFSVSIGLPFVALSASAPLLQSWFAASGQPGAGNPYVLYAASNLGSFAALLLYPFLFEPLLSLRLQSDFWSAGFVVLCLMVGAAGLVVAHAEPLKRPRVGRNTLPGMSERLAWIGLSAIPSGLVVAVTVHITTDIAAAPFLWVLPLALYLLTFVALFRDRPWVSPPLIAKIAPYAIALMTLMLVSGTSRADSWLAGFAVTLFGFLIVALHCHASLYARRPATVRLTEFYLLISVGGVIGGFFAGVLAPNLFNHTWEYPILLALALLTLPGALRGGWRGFAREAGIPIALALIVALAVRFGGVALPEAMIVPFRIALVALVVLMVAFQSRPALGFGLIVLAFVAGAMLRPGVNQIETVRSFFGVHKIAETPDGSHRMLFHGTTMHGAERLRMPDGEPAMGRPEPISYYYDGGPFSDVIAAARGKRPLSNVAVAGLGIGSLSCHRRDGENWTFFEIDPAVVRIARDRTLFRSLGECAPEAEIVVGDARLTLAKSPHRFDLIALDVFSSDAIPAHLLTREAFAGYLSRLEPGGVMLLHISNRHLELTSVVGAVARLHGLAAFVRQDTGAGPLLENFHANALVVAVARNESDLGDLPLRAGWSRIDPKGVAPWTDDYSNIFGALLRMKFGG